MFKIDETLIVNWNANTANTKQFSVSETPVTGNFEKRAACRPAAKWGKKAKTNKQKQQQQQQQKRDETAKIRVQSEQRDGLAGFTRRLCFFLRPYPIFFRLIFPRNAELVQGYLDLALCGAVRCWLPDSRVHRKQNVTPTGIFVGFLET